jgi:hypothetical protein
MHIEANGGSSSASADPNSAQLRRPPYEAHRRATASPVGKPEPTIPGEVEIAMPPRFSGTGASKTQARRTSRCRRAHLSAVSTGSAPLCP